MANHLSVDGNLIVTGSLAVSQIGAGASSVLGFYGTTPVAQPTSSLEAAVGTTAAVSISATQWGFSTSTQANALVTLANQLRADLVTLGLLKGS